MTRATPEDQRAQEAPLTGHCKDREHLNVAQTGANPTDAGPGETTATYIEAMTCPNVAYGGWGVLLAPTGAKNPERGLHLLPDAATFVRDELARLAAGNAHVVIEHTFAGMFRIWRHFTPEGAADLSQLIGAAIDKAPTANTAQPEEPTSR